MTTLTREDLAALGYVERSEGHWEKVYGGAGSGEVIRNGREGAVVAPATTTAPRSPYRSKWEAERADWWESQKRAGDIRDWRYEPLRLRLADGAWYKADFLIQHLDGTLTLEEVKGHWREAALVRYKVARSLYPMFGFRAVTKRGGHWVDAMEGKR